MRTGKPGKTIGPTLGKSRERIARSRPSVHKTVDNLSKTAYTVEQTILDPLCEVRALFRGFSRGIRTFLGRQGQVSQFQKTEWGAR